MAPEVGTVRTRDTDDGSDPSIPYIVDAYMRGLRDYDIETAYEGMRKGATTPGEFNLLRPDNNDYMSKGYVPCANSMIIRFRMPWNIILPTGISRCWQMRWERRKTPSCSVSGLWV